MRKIPTGRKKIAITRALIESFQPQALDETDQQSVYRHISGLRDKLRTHTISLQSQPAQLDRQLEHIESEHLKILQKKPLQRAQATLLDQRNPLNLTTLRLSESLRRQISALPLQQWFLYRRDDQQSRIKLILKLDDFQQLLFCNRLGARSAQFSYEEFAYLLSARTIQPLSLQTQPIDSARKVLQSLYQRYNEQVFNRHTDPVTPTAASPGRQPAEQQAPTLAKAAAENPVRQTATADTADEALTAPPSATAQQPAGRQQQATEAQQLQAATRLVQQLQTGTTVIFTQDGETIPCKLAVKLQSSDQYIFCDRQGIKKYTLSEQALTGLLVRQEATIGDSTDPSADSLSRIVEGFRQQHNE